MGFNFEKHLTNLISNQILNLWKTLKIYDETRHNFISNLYYIEALGISRKISNMFL